MNKSQLTDNQTEIICSEIFYSSFAITRIIVEDTMEANANEKDCATYWGMSNLAKQIMLYADALTDYGLADTTVESILYPVCYKKHYPSSGGTQRPPLSKSQKDKAVVTIGRIAKGLETIIDNRIEGLIHIDEGDKKQQLEGLLWSLRSLVNQIMLMAEALQERKQGHSFESVCYPNLYPSNIKDHPTDTAH